jgi:hypothetical protein
MQHAVMKMILLVQSLLDPHLPLHLAVTDACIPTDAVVAVVAVCSVKMNGSGGSGGGLLHAMFHACRVCCALALAVSVDMAKRWINKHYKQRQ